RHSSPFFKIDGSGQRHNRLTGIPISHRPHSRSPNMRARVAREKLQRRGRKIARFGLAVK
ncbi:MAG TPA: hypothetical protein VF078_09745, partial [Nitrospira sp.]